MKNKRQLRSVALVAAFLALIGTGTVCAQYASSPGVFSVSPTEKVCFAQGNLQYQPSTSNWRFSAPWEYIGTQTLETGWDDRVGNVSGSDNAKLSSDYSGWIDYFAWGTGSNPTTISFERSDQPEFLDWGRMLGNGWRTLTQNEWNYVLFARRTSSGIRFAKARVNHVCGVLLLPDNWTASTFQLTYTNDVEGVYQNNIITKDQWYNELEPAGAVFLPAAGHRESSIIRGGSVWGFYWSSTKTEYGPSCLYFDAYDMFTEEIYYGRACTVRLVRPVSQSPR